MSSGQVKLSKIVDDLPDVPAPEDCLGNPIADSYDRLAAQLDELLADGRDPVANMANAAALIFQNVPDLNWAGFYLFRGSELVLGPFQGQPACVRIALGKGVCGTAAAQRQTLVVPDVKKFKGHIACDRRSRSEIVVPMLDGERPIGVLDLDSPAKDRFGPDDQAGLEKCVAILLRATDFPAN